MANAHKLFPPLPSLSQLLGLHRLGARRPLAQNFLLNPEVTDQLVSRVVDDSRCVLEVGCGPTGLTRSLLACGRFDHVVGVEKDARFAPMLRLLREHCGKKRFSYVIDDILAVDELEVVERDEHAAAALRGDDRSNARLPVQVVGNLPFNISTVLLLKWLRQLYAGESLFTVAPHAPLTLMFQREVADRIVASPGSKRFGRLSVMSQHLCETSVVQHVPARAFTPAPKVDAALVRLVPRQSGAAPRTQSYATLEYVCMCLFAQRRKMLRNTVQLLYQQEQPAAASPTELGQELLTAANVDGRLRAEQLSVDDIVRIADLYHDAQQQQQQ